MRRPMLTAALGAVLVAGCTTSGSSESGPRPAPQIHTPAPKTVSAFGREWVARIDNPWLPYRPGARWVYRGSADGEPTRDVEVVDTATKVIAGVTCTVVHDNLYTAGGRLLERTDDWYAQDADGSVWYFGEDTAELDKQGHVATREGSWEAGVRGARPGLIMAAHPRVGQSYAQEHFAGHAEDHAKVLSVTATVRTPAAHSTSAVQTKEWTPLEPGIVEHKYYVRGVGEVSARVVRGPAEFDRLVSYRRG